MICLRDTPPTPCSRGACHDFAQRREKRQHHQGGHRRRDIAFADARAPPLPAIARPRERENAARRLYHRARRREHSFMTRRRESPFAAAASPDFRLFPAPFQPPRWLSR